MDMALDGRIASRARKRGFSDKFAPPAQMWTAAQCALFAGFKSVDALHYAAKVGKFPAPVIWTGGRAYWLADTARGWIAKRRQAA